MTNAQLSKIRIKRQAPGKWLVVRPAYGFGTLHYSVTMYPTWRAAMRSVLFVSLGGAGSAERDSKRGVGVHV